MGIKHHCQEIYAPNEYMSKRPHYQNVPTFYQNAPVFFLPKRPHYFFRIKIILPKRPHFFIAKTARLIIFFYSNDDIMCDIL